MSGTTLTTTVQVGERTAAQLRASRTAFLAERTRRVRQESSRGRETRTAGGRVAAPALTRVYARRRAIRQVPASTLRQLDLVLERARRGQVTPATAEQAVTAAELAEECEVLRRARQELVMADLLERLPPWIEAPPRLERAADGTLVAHLDVHDAGLLPLEVRPNGQDIRADIDAAGVDHFMGPDGLLIGCDAQRALAGDLTEHWQSSGLEVRSTVTTTEDDEVIASSERNLFSGEQP